MVPLLQAWPSRKACQLFKLLVTHRHRTVSSDELIEICWESAWRLVIEAHLEELADLAMAWDAIASAKPLQIQSFYATMAAYRFVLQAGKNGKSTQQERS
jgi:hypothetical protein